MSIGRKLGLLMGVIFMMGALGLAVLPEMYWPALQLSYALLAAVFVVCGLGLIGLTTSQILWGEASLQPSHPSPVSPPPIRSLKPIIWPRAMALKLKGGLS